MQTDGDAGYRADATRSFLRTYRVQSGRRTTILWPGLYTTLVAAIVIIIGCLVAAPQLVDQSGGPKSTLPRIASGAMADSDSSRTAFLFDALKACGNRPDDESMRRALAFVRRCQNPESPGNASRPVANLDAASYARASGRPDQRP